MFFKCKVARKLAKIGSIIDTSFMVYINNDEPVTFPTKDNLMSYLREYRSCNVISRLQIYRIETYSL